MFFYQHTWIVNFYLTEVLIKSKQKYATWIPKIVYLRVKSLPELNGLDKLNKKKGISATKELFALKESEHIWSWKGTRVYFSVA